MVAAAAGRLKILFPYQAKDEPRPFYYSRRYHRRRAVVGRGLQPWDGSSCIIISLALTTAEVEL